MRLSIAQSIALVSLFALGTSPLIAQTVDNNDDVFHCPEHPPAQWSPTEHLSAKLTKIGFHVDSIHATTGGCYEVQAQNTQGQRVRLQVDPLTLRALKIDSETP